MENYGAIQQRGFLSKRRGGTISGKTYYSVAITALTELATKGYVDTLLAGLLPGKQHADCRAASTANINLAVGGLLTIDDVVLVATNRVLVKDQTLTQQNGIYVAAAGAWTRATDMDATAEAGLDQWVFVSEGTLAENTGWRISLTPATLDVNPLLWSEFTGGGVIPASFQPTEDLTAQVGDGTPTVFNLSTGYVAGSLKVYVGGQRQRSGAGNDYVETTPATGVFTFTAGSTPVAGDIVLVDLTRV